MTQSNHKMGGPVGFETGRLIWERCRTAEITEDEAARFLDLAALADGTLTDEEHDRVAALVASDANAASDVAAARALSAGGVPLLGGLERIIERAIAVVDRTPDAKPGPISPQRSGREVLHRLAQWGSLSAAMAFASWLGFAMGSGASLTLIQPSPTSQISDDNSLPELLDPSTGFLRDLGAGQQT